MWDMTSHNEKQNVVICKDWLAWLVELHHTNRSAEQNTFFGIDEISSIVTSVEICHQKVFAIV